MATSDERSITEEVNSFLESIKGTYVDDRVEAERRLDTPGTQFDRKNYVRAVFAYVEGTTSQWRRAALSSRASLSRAEAALASEESYQLSAEGEAEAHKRPLRTLPSVLFSLRLWAKVMEVPFKPEQGSPGWDAFKKALRIRDRITHPKSLSESRVSDEDLAMVRKASAWFEGQMQAIIEAGFARRPAPKK